MISSSIFKRPYSFGNPLVLETSIIVSVDVTSLDNNALSTITSGFKLSTFKYWSRLSVRSIGPPWYSWEI